MERATACKPPDTEHAKPVRPPEVQRKADPVASPGSSNAQWSFGEVPLVPHAGSIHTEARMPAAEFSLSPGPSRNHCKCAACAAHEAE